MKYTLNEQQLSKLITESVHEVLCNEGFGDKLKGAMYGLQQGQRQQLTNNVNSQILQQVKSMARNGIKNPSAAIQAILKYITKMEGMANRNIYDMPAETTYE